MADRKNNNVPNTGANLLFSGAPEFNFNLPFMPVSQATGPAVLSGGETEMKPLSCPNISCACSRLSYIANRVPVLLSAVI